MSEELKYVKMDEDFRDYDKVDELYNAAFPPGERFFTIEEARKHREFFEKADAQAVYDDGMLVGFYVVSVSENYKYLQFIAVNQNIRSKGYGGRILSKLLRENENGIFFASIENPDPEAADYETKLRRQKFYEKNGMISVNRVRDVNGVKFIVVTNKTGEEFDKCYENEINEEKKQIREALRVNGDGSN